MYGRSQEREKVDRTKAPSSGILPVLNMFSVRVQTSAVSQLQMQFQIYGFRLCRVLAMYYNS